MCMKILAHIVITALALLLIAQIIPGVEIASFTTALIAALVLGVLNAFVKPILVILTFPITIVTLGLFIFVINAGLFLFAASFIDGFSVSGFFPALLGSLVVSVVSTATQRLLS